MKFAYVRHETDIPNEHVWLTALVLRTYDTANSILEVVHMAELLVQDGEDVSAFRADVPCEDLVDAQEYRMSGEQAKDVYSEEEFLSVYEGASWAEAKDKWRFFPIGEKEMERTGPEYF